MGFKHLHLEINNHEDGHHYARLSLDFEGRSANILSMAMIDEISRALDEVKSQKELSFLVLQSAKPSGFVFGADITEFEDLTSEDEVRALQKQAMALLDKLENLPLVTIAFIHGPALGGGLELALACDYRLINAKGRLMLGFPEVNLGLMPGFAGTARASRLIGAELSLSLCETGKPITMADKAVEMGLADEAVAEEELVQKAHIHAEKGKAVYEEKPPLNAKDIKTSLERKIAQSAPDSIPHIKAIYEHFEKAGTNYDGFIQGELAHFPPLMMHPVSKALRRVFALTDKVKKQAKGQSAIEHIYVIGAGAMGGDIATLLAYRGKKVTLFDVSWQAMEKAQEKAAAYFARKLSPDECAQAQARLTLAEGSTDMSQFDLVIEAAPEKMALKQAIWADIESKVRDDCILASNTSALDLGEIASVLSAKDRLVGLHFFNPAVVMPLVEVIHRGKYDAPIFDELMKLVISLGKMPIMVRNSPGFIVNRALLPYIYEAIATMIDGTAADEIDQAFIAYGMPMGPIELADQIGLDVCLDAGQPLGMAEAVRQTLEAKIAQNELGRKTGKGFYEWAEKAAIRPRADYDEVSLGALQRRIIAPLIAACQEAVDNGDVSDADFVDAAMIFGMGFPRHKGGPLYAHDSLS